MTRSTPAARSPMPASTRERQTATYPPGDTGRSHFLPALIGVLLGAFLTCTLYKSLAAALYYDHQPLAVSIAVLVPLGVFSVTGARFYGVGRSIVIALLITLPGYPVTVMATKVALGGTKAGFPAALVMFAACMVWFGATIISLCGGLVALRWGGRKAGRCDNDAGVENRWHPPGSAETRRPPA